MLLTDERQMVLQAVLDGQIGGEHVTEEELIWLHHEAADHAIKEDMWTANARGDVTVFALDWEYLRPN